MRGLLFIADIHLYREHLYRFITEVRMCDCLDFISVIRNINSAAGIVALRISLCDNQAVILHAVRQAKRKANMTYMKAYQKAWKEHRDRYQQDMEKLESENMELRRKLGEAKRDIDAYKRLFNGESHA
ncbi:hypothetical protein M1R49_003735 [Escherichia coli]|nr:hypothetical protein [Escherichia coli]EJD2091753.1 hypothetical protein [Escherichia coli]